MIRIVKWIIKVTGLIILGIILIFVISITGFVNLSPQFGAEPKGESLERIKRSGNYKDGRFANAPDSVDIWTFSDYMNMISEMLEDRPRATPPKRALPKFTDAIKLNAQPEDSLTKITWLGHSAIFLEIDEHNLLIDPMLGTAYGPVTFMPRGQRFGNSLPVSVADLPHIDAVLISHDHYDHLDYASIQQLKGKVDHYFVPLGVGAHLVSWGVDEQIITELDWWEEAEYKELTVVATPAQHFSGRGPMNKFSTLWASWVIKGKKHRVYFSGDSGYFQGFKAIGERYGPFDLTMIECGQYSTIWPYHHLFPEFTAQAHIDLKGKVLMPIHWGALLLSPSHDWDEPIERLSIKAKELKIPLTTPMIGQTVTLDTEYPDSRWWRSEEGSSE